MHFSCDRSERAEQSFFSSLLAQGVIGFARYAGFASSAVLENLLDYVADHLVNRFARRLGRETAKLRNIVESGSRSSVRAVRTRAARSICSLRFCRNRLSLRYGIVIAQHGRNCVPDLSTVNGFCMNPAWDAKLSSAST